MRNFLFAFRPIVIAPQLTASMPSEPADPKPVQVVDAQAEPSLRLAVRLLPLGRNIKPVLLV